jgi:ferredoxin-type protein NapG
MLGLGTLKFVPTRPICRPPGGQDEDSFLGACLRCERCREICPQNVIVPAHLEQGILNVRTPTMNFKEGWCDFCEEANAGIPLCEGVCPTKALRLVPDFKPEEVVIGKAVINRNWCLGWLLKGCKKCFEVCPYEAIEMEQLEGLGNYNNSDYQRPHVIEDKCNGCGLCENRCPSMMNSSLTEGATDRAITVHAVTIQGD